MTTESGTALVPSKEGSSLPPGEVNARYAIVTSASDLSAVRDTWITTKRVELQRGLGALVALRKAGASAARLAAVRDRVGMLKKVVKALELGYVPIPRFDSQTLNIDVQELPGPALVALAAARQAKLFHEVRFVTGRRETQGRGYFRVRQRDPLLIGIVRTRHHVLSWRNMDGRQWADVEVPSIEEHFMVAWWRPEDERADVLF